MIDFKQKKIAIDSMVVIYLLDKNPRYWELISDILDSADAIVFSTLLYGEVLAGLYKAHDQEALEQFLNFVQSSKKIQVCSFTAEVAIQFAKLRAAFPSLKPPDGIHIATAMHSKADVFLTNDLKIKNIKNLKILQLSNYV